MTSFLSMKEICCIVTLAHAMEEIDEIMKKPVSEQEIKALETIKDGFESYKNAFLKRIDRKSMERLRSKVLNYYPVLTPLTTNKTERLQITLDDFFSLAETVLDCRCKGCNGKNGECEIREVLAQNFIPEYHETDADHPCCYMY